jgi:uncharacterized protein (DUF924 family)
MSHTAFPDLAAADTVLDYWFGDSLAQGWPVVPRKPLWFGSDPATDDTIRQRFGSLVEQAVAGGLRAWEPDARSRLALLVLLDQFTRNLWRGQAAAFAGDARACALALDALDRGLDRQLPPIGRVFVFMPLMHAEDLGLQDRCIACFEALQAATPDTHTVARDDIASHLQYARLHRDIVLRFGRFPHRNAALGRRSTDEETAFLVDGPRFGQ